MVLRTTIFWEHFSKTAVKIVHFKIWNRDAHFYFLPWRHILEERNIINFFSKLFDQQCLYNIQRHILNIFGDLSRFRSVIFKAGSLQWHWEESLLLPFFMNFIQLINPLSANPTKWSNTFKQFVAVGGELLECLTVLWGWHLKELRFQYFQQLCNVTLGLINVWKFLENGSSNLRKMHGDCFL